MRNIKKMGCFYNMRKMKNRRLKQTIVMTWLLALFFIIGILFWYNALVYSFPTPIPDNYKPVPLGQVINIHLKGGNNSKPLLLHFFNPDCPCSRFNISNFKRLHALYGSKLTFVIVVLSPKPYTIKDIQKKFNLDIPVFFDQSIATSCGVYSTPQVAILDSDYKLYYRGNYNRSRYCTDEKTSFVRIAIEGLLSRKFHLKFNPLALRAYGCQLPDCTK